MLAGRDPNSLEILTCYHLVARFTSSCFSCNWTTALISNACPIQSQSRYT